ncbi:MAG: ATP-binding cassette domain-containing protein [Dongiaceae bacterium]
MLSASGLHYGYPGGGEALAGLDLEIARGERLAILGANGAGKTTLLMLLNGTLRPGRGAIRIDGVAAGYDQASLRRWRQRVGLVLQDPDDQLFAASVFEDVSFGPLNLGLDAAAAAARVGDALAAMRIADLAERPTHMLSYGQRKRVAIAGIVAMKPEILLLDEPTAGLDPLGVVHLLGTMRGLAERGTAIVLATHDMDLAYGWADRIAIFGERRIALAGPPDRVFEDAAMLKRLRLRPPLLWEIGRALRQRGMLDSAKPLPRSRHEMLEALSLPGREPGTSHRPAGLS